MLFLLAITFSLARLSAKLILVSGRTPANLTRRAGVILKVLLWKHTRNIWMKAERRLIMVLELSASLYYEPFGAGRHKCIGEQVRFTENHTISCIVGTYRHP